MTLLTLTQVEKSHGDRQIFSGANLRIDEGDRIGIIGDNGVGKTTLVRILVGEEPPDRGERVARRNLKLAWTSQIPELDMGSTVASEARRSFNELERMESELRELEEEMANNPENRSLHEQHERIHTAFDAGGGYRREQFLEQALIGVGFLQPEFAKPVENLSGGEKARVALARVMLQPAELLILDEPTNHLDLDGLAFFEEWLLSRQAAFLVVSHDRRLLDRVCQSIVEIDTGRVTSYRGNYAAYREQRQRNLKMALRAFKKQEDFIAKEMAFIRKYLGSQRTAEARGRLKRLMRLQRMQRPRTNTPTLKLRLGKAKGLSGQTVLAAEGVGFRWPDGHTLFEGFAFRIFHGDRIGLVGRNGVGKSTLLKILGGELSPSTGELERAAKLSISRFTQEMEDLPMSGTVLGSLYSVVPAWTDQECRDHLALFLFQADEVEQDVGKLSGGEQRRLCLARLVTKPSDILLLDEPTNHLDISAREALEEALKRYPGTVVMVSHDRHFLGEVATRIFEMEPRRLLVHDGGLSQYEERRQMRRTEAKEPKARTSRAGSGVPGPASKALIATGQTVRQPRARRAREPRKPRGSGVRNPYAFARLEEEIIRLEEELERIHEELGNEKIWQQPDRVKGLKNRQEELEAELAAKYERWENWE